MLLVKWCHFKSTKASVGMNPMHSESMFPGHLWHHEAAVSLTKVSRVSISFLKIVLSGPHEYWSGFTSHFTLTNMKGTFSTKVTDAIKTMQPKLPVAVPWPAVLDDDHLIEAAEVASTFNVSSVTRASSPEIVLHFPTQTVKGEAEHNELRKRQVGAVGGIDAGIGAAATIDQHTVPYGEQTGSTKYAPMPKSAGTAVATRSATPQYPPFPFSIATTYLGAPTVQYTEMLYATWTANSIENTVSRCLIFTVGLISEADLFPFYSGCSRSHAHIRQENAKVARPLAGLI
jgi:hypothetical protein